MAGYSGGGQADFYRQPRSQTSGAPRTGRIGGAIGGSNLGNVARAITSPSSAHTTSRMRPIGPAMGASSQLQKRFTQRGRGRIGARMGKRGGYRVGGGR